MSACEHCTNLLPEGYNTAKELSLTATQIALQNFEWRYVTFVFFNSTLWYGVEVFLQSYKKSTIVGKGTFYPKFVDRTRQYVLFGINLVDVVHVLKWMTDHEFDNTGKFIIVCESQVLDDCDERKAVNALWKYKVTNVVFLRRIEEEVVGYTYFPLNNSDCKTDVPVKLTNLNLCFNKTYQFCRDIFSLKLINFNKCPLIASSFIQPPYMKIVDGVPSGANGDLLLILAERLNATLEPMTPRIGNGWGKLEEDGTWSGSLADVYYDYANFSMTSAAITLARFSYFQMSFEYHTSSVVWVMHPAKKMPSSLKLTHPFQPSTQIAVCICFILVIICALIRRTKLWDFYGRIIEGSSRPRSSIVFYSWMICMGLPSTRLPTKPAYIYMVLLWMWFCIFVRTIYQVSLITVLKANYYFGEFETIDDVLDANYPFGGGAALKDFYIDYPIVYNKWIDINTDDIIPMLRNVSYGVEFVLAMSLEMADAVISQEKINVHILPQKVMTCPTVIFFKKFSPIAKPINKILVKLVESGFSDKLKQIYSSTAKINKSADTLEPINMDHYTGCYMLLVSGWVISLVFFVGEIIFDRMQSRRNKRVVQGNQYKL